MQLEPKYDYDTQVRVIRNIRSDAYSLDTRKGELLIRRGATGYVRNSGVYKQEQIIYQVHFLDTNQVIGCKESELIPADTPWIQNLFETGDRVKLTANLDYKGTPIAQRDEQFQIMGVDRTDPDNILYHLNIMHTEFEIPESALVIADPAPSATEPTAKLA